MTPSRARPLESLSAAQSVGCDDTGFTLVTRRKKKKDIPEMKSQAATHRVAPSFFPSSWAVILPEFRLILYQLPEQFMLLCMFSFDVQACFLFVDLPGPL
jgi:hypothetical protein